MSRLRLRSTRLRLQTANAQFERVLTVRREQAASDDRNVAAAHRLLAEAAQIRTLLAEIAKTGDAKNALDHDELVMLLQDIRNAILKSIGRRS